MAKIRNQGSWTPIENWPQTFYKRNRAGKIVVLTVYVDDFVMGGPNREKEWEAIRNVVVTTEPTVVDRVLVYIIHLNVIPIVSQ